ncbi:hypothetical protein MMC21_001963 [Puttea exsequens]|nr:hypothetical protein [Puttea exsequens]
MTSRKKIAAITKAAKRYECAVYLKTGAHPPGVMIAESEGEKDMRGWVGAVKGLRYKDFQLLRSEAVDQGELGIRRGLVSEFESMKSLAANLARCNVLGWWRLHMGFTKSDESSFG